MGWNGRVVPGFLWAKLSSASIRWADAGFSTRIGPAPVGDNTSSQGSLPSTYPCPQPPAESDWLGSHFRSPHLFVT